jgi:RimJ/RimL family protein N-acetyltransferase
MEIRPFKPEDLPALHALLTSNRWDYFLDPVIDEQGLKKRDEIYFSGDTAETLVAMDDSGTLIGFVQFEEVNNNEDASPSFTVCIDKESRGKGIGAELLRQGTAHIFNKFDKIRRIYATTRADNMPMQKLFEATGFRQEARHKKEWKNRETGEFIDALGYAILREEFQAN